MSNEPGWDDLFPSQPSGQPPESSGSMAVPQTRREAREASQGKPGQGAQTKSAGPTYPAGKESGSNRKPRKRRRWLAWVISLVVIFALIGAGTGYAWLNFEPQIRKLFGWELPPPDYEGNGTGEATIVIHAGDSGTEVTKALVDAGVVRSFDAFYSLLLVQDPPVEFFPGYYVLAKKMSSAAALAALKDPANRVENRAIVQEGKTVAQIFDILSATTGIAVADFEAAGKNLGALGVPADAPNLEGYLFPATYIFDPGVDAFSVLKVMVDRTFQALDAAGVAVADRTHILTIASLIQREAGGNAEDFFKVSRVIQNRLAEGMKLQFDSTAHYGYVWSHGDRQDGGVFSSQDELDDDNPYNTYVISGLPQGPIGAAGDLAIDAALHPAEGPWLYFVTVNLDTGETAFTTTNAEHLAAVRQLLDWCRATQSPNCD